MKKFITAIFVFLLASESLFATPNPAVIYVTGTVVDHSSNETLPGVEVRVKGTDIVTYTNFDGNFFLPELPAGTYTLEFSCITYNSTTVLAVGTDAEPQVKVAMEQR